MIKVAIVGINGLVGSELEKLIKNNTNWEITAVTSKDNIDYEYLRKHDFIFLCVDNDI
ncbi:MAG: hypothetical protein ACK4GR_06555, partial [bacterium]